MAVIFKSENHLYESVDSSNSIKWTSVTTFISKFKKAFDAVKMSEKSSKNKKSKWYGMTPEEVRDAWKKISEDACAMGTWYHNEREVDILSCSSMEKDGIELPVVPPIFKDGIKHAPDQKLVEGIYPEHFVYLKSAGICGQADLIEVYNGAIHITDYKTNKEIKMEGFKSWDGVVSKMNQPINHIDDCNYWHYALQLSLYMYIMLKHNPRLKAGVMQIHHIIFEEGLDEKGNPLVKEVVPYEVPYLKDEIIKMLHWAKDNPRLFNA